MNREQLAHVLRAAAKVAGDPGIVVIGSQAILASFDNDVLPLEAIRSVEADLVFLDDPDEEKADLIDGVIGEESAFHQTYGYYGQGVTLSTAVLPEGWRERLIPFTREDAQPAEAACLEPYDVATAKLVAGREKDYEYVRALLDCGLLQLEILRARCEALPGPLAVQYRVVAWLERRVD